MINPDTTEKTDLKLWAKNGNSLAYQTGVLKSNPKIKVGFISDTPVDKHTDQEIILIYSLPKFDCFWILV